MITTSESNAMKTLLLTPKESEALLELLDQAVPESHSAHDSNVLLAVRDKLDDAAGIARWLRENTTCELTLPEFHAVDELLVSP